MKLHERQDSFTRATAHRRRAATLLLLTSVGCGGRIEGENIPPPTEPTGIAPNPRARPPQSDGSASAPSSTMPSAAGPISFSREQVRAAQERCADPTIASGDSSPRTLDQLSGAWFHCWDLELTPTPQRSAFESLHFDAARRRWSFLVDDGEGGLRVDRSGNIERNADCTELTFATMRVIAYGDDRFVVLQDWPRQTAASFVAL